MAQLQQGIAAMAAVRNAGNDLHKAIGMGSTDQGKTGSGGGMNMQDARNMMASAPQLGNLFANGMPQLKKAADRAGGTSPSPRQGDLRDTLLIVFLGVQRPFLIWPNPPRFPACQTEARYRPRPSLLQEHRLLAVHHRRRLLPDVLLHRALLPLLPHHPEEPRPQDLVFRHLRRESEFYSQDNVYLIVLKMQTSSHWRAFDASRSSSPTNRAEYGESLIISVMTTIDIAPTAKSRPDAETSCPAASTPLSAQLDARDPSSTSSFRPIARTRRTRSSEEKTASYRSHGRLRRSDFTCFCSPASPTASGTAGNGVACRSSAKQEVAPAESCSGAC